MELFVTLTPAEHNFYNDLTLTTAEQQLVDDWIEQRPDAGDAVIALPVERRRVVLAALGYDTPSHLALFGL
jgi:hypothetical protein